MEQTLEKATIRKNVGQMIIPITIENVLQMLVGFVSMALIGRIHPMAIAAFGLGNRVNNMLWAFFKGIAIGCQIFVARAFGSGRHKDISKAIQQTLLSVVFIGILLNFLLHHFATDILMILFHPKAALLKEAAMALRILSFCIPFLAVVLVIGSSLQGMGDSKTPMFIALFMNGVNVVVSYLIIFGNLGFPKLGLRGAAIGVVIAQIAAALVGLHVLFGPKGKIRFFNWQDFFVPDFATIKRVYHLGIPTSLESLFWQFSTIILTRALLVYGEVTYAAYQLGLQAEAISYMPAAGFSVAATAFVGQHLGAQDTAKAKAYFGEILKGSVLISFICGVPLIFFSRGVMRLLTPDEMLIQIGASYVFVMGFAQLSQNLAGILSGALRGAGYTEMPMLSAGIGLWLVRVPLSLLIAYVWKLDVFYIFLVIGLDMTIRFIFNGIVFKKINIYQNYRVLK